MTRAKNPRPLSPERKARAEAAGYDIGFGKTPAETRFQKGKSGNPSGRHKGKTGLTLFRELLEQPVALTLNGEPQTLSFLAALIQITGASGLKGTARDREQLFKLIERLAPEAFQEPPQKKITPERAAIVERFKRRVS